MSKKLNTKKASQGFSVIKVNNAKKAVNELKTYDKHTDARDNKAWGKVDKEGNFTAGKRLLACEALFAISKSKKDATGKDRVYITKKDKELINLDVLNYTANDTTKMVFIGKFVHKNKYDAIKEQVVSGTPKKPQAMWNAINPDANAKRASNNGDIDKWIAGVVASAIRRGLTKQQLSQKIVVACGGQATFTTKPQGTTNANKLLEVSTFESKNKKRSKK